MKKIIVALTLMLSMMISVPAHAGNGTPGCVSFNEYQTITRSTMSNVEAFLEVTGQGSVVVYQNQGQNIVKQYAWCGHTTNQGYFQIAYAKNLNGQYMSQYISWFDFT